MDIWYRIIDCSVKFKRILIVSIIIIIAGVSTVLVVQKYSKDKLSDYNTNLSTVVEYNGTRWEVYKSYESKCLIVLKDGEMQYKKAFEVSENETQVMKLPVLDNVKSKDITGGEVYCKSTWRASLEESAQQIKKFSDDGYSIVFKSETQYYIELYIKNDKSNYKRLIITPDKISIVDVAEFKFESIEDYIY